MCGEKASGEELSSARSKSDLTLRSTRNRKTAAQPEGNSAMAQRIEDSLTPSIQVRLQQLVTEYRLIAEPPPNPGARAIADELSKRAADPAADASVTRSDLHRF